MEITRYKAERFYQDGLHTIYTVPTGKVAKLKFNAGFVDTDNINLLKFNTTGYSYSYLMCTNSCGVKDTIYGVQLKVAGTTVLGSYNNNSSTQEYIKNMFFNGDDIYTYPDYLTASDILYDLNSVVTDTFTRSFKNDFILVEGDAVTIDMNSTSRSYASINYDFTIFEEDLH